MQGDAVVYVHGLWLSGQEAFLLRRRIESARGCVWHNFSYYSVWQSLAEVTRALGAFVRGLGAPHVHLVGHSLGGLVILRCLEQYRDLPPGRVVFLGTPALASLTARRVGRFRIGRAVMGPVVAAELLRDHERSWRSDRELGLIAGSRSLGAGRLVADCDGKDYGMDAVASASASG